MRAKRSGALHDLNRLLDEPGSGWSEYPEISFLDFGGGESGWECDVAVTGGHCRTGAVTGYSEGRFLAVSAVLKTSGIVSVGRR